MTTRDHNRTLGLIHALVGTLVLTGFIIAAISEVRRHPSEALERLWWMLYVLPLPLLQVFTAYGVFTVKKWGRAFALLFSILYVWLFPLGTLLAVYTWWVLYGETGRQLYGAKPPAELNER